MSTSIVITRRLPATLLSKILTRPSTVIQYHDSNDAISSQKLLELCAKNGGASAILCTLTDSINKSVIDACNGKLKVISTMSVGYSHIDTKLLKDYNIQLGNTPGVLTNATADLVMALVLATARRITEAASAAKNGEWKDWKPFWMCGKELFGSKVGILGLGRIGEAIVKRLRGFDCEVIYTGRSGSKPTLDSTLNTRWVDSDELYSTSDFIIVICALTPETKGLINYQAFSKMKENVTFINASRGEVVDQEALVRILHERPEMRAGLDVTSPEPLPLDHPLLHTNQCIILPHIGSATESCRTNMALLTIDNALAVLDEKTMPSEVKL
jgi:glyoxylate/hydroxypyruvate reductase